jgi:hypothetical protein
MQMIIQLKMNVDQYVEQEFHKRVLAPEHCGNCGKVASLNILSSYERYTTNDSGAVVLFRVARFVCKVCKLTTSCLPSFAQPYRLVASETIEAFVMGDFGRFDVRNFEWLLVHYLENFDQWHRSLLSVVGSRFGRAPPGESATAFLRRAVAVCNSFAELTLRLVQEFKTTCFRNYRCHQPSCSY